LLVKNFYLYNRLLNFAFLTPSKNKGSLQVRLISVLCFLSTNKNKKIKIACVGIIQNKKLFAKIVPDDQSFTENYAGIFHFR